MITKIRNNEKCLTIEWIYLSLKNWNFDNKIKAVFNKIKDKGLLKSLENLEEFKELIFTWKFKNWKEITKELKEKIEEIIKKNILEKIDLLDKKYHDDFLKLFFIEQEETSLEENIIKKVSEEINFIIRDNYDNLDKPFSWITKKELFLYVISLSDEEKIKLLQIPTIYNNFSSSDFKKIVLSFLSNEKKIEALKNDWLINFFYDKDLKEIEESFWSDKERKRLKEIPRWLNIKNKVA